MFLRMSWILVGKLLAGLLLFAYLIRQAGRPDRFAGRWFADANRAVMALLGGRGWTEEQHRHWFAAAGLADVEVRTEPSRGWIAVTGRRSTVEGQRSDP